MNEKKVILVGMMCFMLLFSSCDGIPTLPPADSTIIIDVGRKRTEAPPPSITPKERSTKTVPPPSDTLQPSRTPTQAATDPPATETAAPTASPQPSLTPSRTLTATPQPTWTFTPTYTLTSSPSPTSTPFPYAFQEGSPSYLDNFAHPEAGCSWLGVAGQIFDGEGNPEKDVIVKAGGTLDGEPVFDTLSMPGAAKAYGQGGYELVLSDHVLASEGEAWVQLYNLHGQPISEKLELTTYADCQKNLILLNFVRR